MVHTETILYVPCSKSDIHAIQLMLGEFIKWHNNQGEIVLDLCNLLESEDRTNLLLDELPGIERHQFDAVEYLSLTIHPKGAR